MLNLRKENFRVKIGHIRVASSIMIRMRSNSYCEINIGYLAIGFCPNIKWWRNCGFIKQEATEGCIVRSLTSLRYKHVGLKWILQLVECAWKEVQQNKQGRFRAMHVQLILQSLYMSCTILSYIFKSWNYLILDFHLHLWPSLEVAAWTSNRMICKFKNLTNDF